MRNYRDSREHNDEGDYGKKQWRYEQKMMHNRHRGEYEGERGYLQDGDRMERGYRMPPSYEGRGDSRGGSREDYLNTMYESSNVYGMPRHEDYGLPHGAENDVNRIHFYPLDEGPYGHQRSHYRYSMGYDPNLDNPEEGDRYRNFDSRGNHGYRHDASYGHEDEFRDFGNDHYGPSDRTGNW
ncbi:hypothetical protein [Pontibacter vulgaris]|uniref:hypothetical protein n=1 Tax=Pontibacter vulgaris TaxID=2905679 RepID=UPI001FA78E4D|nr:hypothetical protein [Pontibacter vulgaris]